MPSLDPRPIRRTNLCMCSSVSWYNANEQLRSIKKNRPGIEARLVCAMYDWHGSDIISTYVTVPTCTVLQSHSPKQFTYACMAILTIHSPISQSGGQVIVNGLDSMSTSTCKQQQRNFQNCLSNQAISNLPVLL